MESAKTYPRSNPLLSLSTFIHQHCLRLGAELSTRFEDTKRLAGILAGNCAPLASRRMCSAPVAPPFAWLAQSNHALAATLSSDHVAKSLAGTAVYTVSNSNNEFVLISDPNESKSIGLLCFRQEDAEAFLAQVRSRRELRSAAKVVPITLDQVYMLKVEGIAFRFLPDPVQIRNALELKSSDRSAFDGVPVFQEDIEKELSKVSRASRGPGVSQHIMVGSLEDVLRKMESSEKNSGWEDLIFIPPGKSYSQHIQDVVKA
ncbi:protein TIC 22, chloroplastic-like isoform X2 [Pyrus communis]|uniref:protein TIC 22, chloroplastic-like isoform X2 n=1 Tax=Pyrus communis TaxID=23211 RepID=UPI0035BFB306